MKPAPQRPPLPLPTFELLLAGSSAVPVESDWKTALRREASDAMDAASQVTHADMWSPASWWVRGPSGKVDLVVVERDKGVRS